MKVLGAIWHYLVRADHSQSGWRAVRDELRTHQEGGEK